MQALEDLAEGLGILHELQKPGLLCEREHAVRPNVQAPASGLPIPSKRYVHKVEDLLHHGVLTHIVIALALDLD